MNIAIAHEWLTFYAGSEKVLEQILKIYPESDLYTLVDFMTGPNRDFLAGTEITTSFIQRMPFARKRYRAYLPLMPLAIEQFDLSDYDLVLTSSTAVSKGVITGPDQLHICYCHSPVRYAWDLQFQYLKESGLDKGLRSLLARLVLHYIRQWDYRTANGVDEFIANSNFIARRIEKVYRRKSTVIHPPVNTDYYSLESNKEDYYLAVSRLVPYKKMQLIVEAFSHMPDKKLVVIGDGPCMNSIKSVASQNIEILGYQDDVNLLNYMKKAKAFVFSALEDFGILPVEAQACGTPVIAFGRGGVLDTVIDGETGVLFYKQTVSDIVDAIYKFEQCEFDPCQIRKNAEKFSTRRFEQKYSAFVMDKWLKFKGKD